MAATLPSRKNRELTLGISVSRAAALLPQTATGAIFNVTGGKILVTSLIGEVVVVMPATTNAVKVVGTPTSGTAVDWTTATSTASAQVGSVISLPITAGGALAVANAGAGNAVGPGFIAQVGTIGLNTTGSAATGTVRWSLTFVPIDDGAAVTAA